MSTRFHLLCGCAGLSALVGLAGPALSAWATASDAACAAAGSYAIVNNGSRFAASAPLSGSLPIVYGGTADLQSYTACGAPTKLRITTDGPGTLLSQPVPPLLGYQLRAAGDLLLRFTGVATQDPMAPQDAQAVRLNGTATYVHVTTQGKWLGKRRLTYATKTVTVKNVMAHLKITADFGGAFSLGCALPGPAIDTFPSSFAYFAVGARNPAKLTAARTPDKNL